MCVYVLCGSPYPASSAAPYFSMCTLRFMVSSNFIHVPSGDIELCVRPGKIHRCNKAVGKEESERCPVCFDYRVPEDDPLVVCEVCEIFAHRVRKGLCVHL